MTSTIVTPEWLAAEFATTAFILAGGLATMHLVTAHNGVRHAVYSTALFVIVVVIGLVLVELLMIGGDI